MFSLFIVCFWYVIVMQEWKTRENRYFNGPGKEFGLEYLLSLIEEKEDPQHWVFAHDHLSSALATALKIEHEVASLNISWKAQCPLQNVKIRENREKEDINLASN